MKTRGHSIMRGSGERHEQQKEEQGGKNQNKNAPITTTETLPLSAKATPARETTHSQQREDGGSNLGDTDLVQPHKRPVGSCQALGGLLEFLVLGLQTVALTRGSLHLGRELGKHPVTDLSVGVDWKRKTSG